MAKILITGGTGLVGSRLTEMLVAKKYEVVILSRNPQKENEFKWDIANNYINEKALDEVSHIVHLAGAGIAEKRWTKQRKKHILDSRIQSVNLLFNKIKTFKKTLKGFISASGTGYYGAVTSETIFDENHPAANDFLGEVCQKWEQAALQFEIEKIPVSIFRTGIVLSKKGGALEKMKTPIMSPIGSGKQYLPWIHLDDLCQLYIDAIDGKLVGVFNAVAPEIHTSATFSKELSESIKRPFLNIGVPAFLLKLVFGELAIILLTGSRICHKKTEKHGFKFQFKTLKKALEN